MHVHARVVYVSIVARKLSQNGSRTEIEYANCMRNDQRQMRSNACAEAMRCGKTEPASQQVHCLPYVSMSLSFFADCSWNVMRCLMYCSSAC